MQMILRDSKLPVFLYKNAKSQHMTYKRKNRKFQFIDIYQKNASHKFKELLINPPVLGMLIQQGKFWLESGKNTGDGVAPYHQ